MAQFEPGNILAHLTLVQTLHSQTIQNGYHFTNRDSMSEASLPDLMAQLISHFTLFILPSIKAFASQEVVYRAMVASVLIPHDGPIFEQVLETSDGSQGYESLPSYCAAVITLRSGFGGKRNRGRSYYAGPVGELCSNSRLDPDYLAVLQNIGNQLVNTFGYLGGISPFTYAVYSRKGGDLESGKPTAIGIVPIRQAVARSILGTCRHRKIGIGN